MVGMLGAGNCEGLKSSRYSGRARIPRTAGDWAKQMDPMGWPRITCGSVQNRPLDHSHQSVKAQKTFFAVEHMEYTGTTRDRE